MAGPYCDREPIGWWLVPPDLDFLTPRQADVARLIAEGLADKEIAVRLGVSRATVKNHMRRVRGRMGVRDRTSVAVFVLSGWLPKGARCDVSARRLDAA